MKAIQSGPLGSIAVAMLDWAGNREDYLQLDWTVVKDKASATALSQRIRALPYHSGQRTSISNALEKSFVLLNSSDGAIVGTKKVVDVSGDGPNNNGEPVAIARDAALAKGVIINGLPIMVKAATYATMDIDNLDIYYEDCVIGGPGSFVVPIKERARFKEAIRTKLILEVANLKPDAVVVPVQARQPRVPCTIGEQLWRERWGR